MVLAAAISTAACSAMGKSGEKLPAENSVMIDEGGNKIAAFNSSLGKPAQAVNSSGSERLPVAIGSVAVGNGTATLITEYDTPSRLVEFAGEIGDYNVPFTALEVGRVASAGQSFEGLTFKDEKGNTVDAQTVRAGNEKLAVKAEGQGIIKTENAILYISDGCTLQDSRTVQTAQEGTSIKIIYYFQRT